MGYIALKRNNVALAKQALLRAVSNQNTQRKEIFIKAVGLDVSKEFLNEKMIKTNGLMYGLLRTIPSNHNGNFLLKTLAGR